MPRDVVVVVSNRGPVSFHREADGGLVSRRGGGGLATSLAPLLEDTGCLWVAAAMTDEDREAAASGLVEADGFRLRTLDIDPDTYAQAYDVVSNATLWFVHHDLFDLPRRPLIDRRWREAWEGYRRYNQAFAEVVAEEVPEGAAVLVQDYHLALVGTWLAKLRPELRAVHFSHTPFAGPVAMRVLPDEVAEELLNGMATFRACGFHSRRWADSFASCYEALGMNAPDTFVAPVAPDASELEALSSGADAEPEERWLAEVVGDRRMVLRVDRIELSKNILRGFLAFDDLLQTNPGWRGKVVFVALMYPSREALADYLAYRSEVESLVDRINRRWATPDWTPIVLDSSDNLVRSAVAMSRYDVLLVNPVRDGLNLVALEGALINQCDGVVALSREAGVFDTLGDAALDVHPFDVAGTSEVLLAALEMGHEERARRAHLLRTIAAARQPRDWLDDQLRAARA